MQPLNFLKIKHANLPHLAGFLELLKAVVNIAIVVDEGDVYNISLQFHPPAMFL